jgi:hypothetical protein
LDESPHVHVAKQSAEAKYWLNPIGLSRSRGFRERELREIERILVEHQAEILAAWREEEVKRGDGES